MLNLGLVLRYKAPDLCNYVFIMPTTSSFAFPEIRLWHTPTEALATQLPFNHLPPPRDHIHSHKRWPCSRWSCCNGEWCIVAAGRIRNKLLDFEFICDERTHVICSCAALQEGQQPQQLLVLDIIIPALDGDAIAQLESKGLHKQQP